MNDFQRNRYFGLYWPDACAAKGWRVKDEVRRRHTTGECMSLVRGPQTESITEMGDDEVTALFTYLDFLAHPGDLIRAAKWVDCMMDYRMFNRARQSDWHERKTYGPRGSGRLRKQRFAGKSAQGEPFEKFDPEAVRKQHMTMAARHRAKGYRPTKQMPGDLRFVTVVGGKAVAGPELQPAHVEKEEDPF